MSILSGVGLQFAESMCGYIGKGQTDPTQGTAVGKRRNDRIRFDVQIAISDLSRFVEVGEHKAELSGTISCDLLGGTFSISDGTFNLLSVSAETGIRQMVYSFKFKDVENRPYNLYGHKEIHDNSGKIDLLEDMTRLFVVIYSGEDKQAPIYGAGEMYFKLKDGPAMISSMKVTGAATLWQKVAAYSAFTSFAYGALRDEYLKDVHLYYDTQYENLVLSGFLRDGEATRPFFMVSGEHDKGFPWGDGETFWDVMLVIDDGENGIQRYGITDRVLDSLDLGVERGTYRYEGPLYSVKEGYSTSFSQIRSKADNLIEFSAKIEINFEAHPYEPAIFPFVVEGKLFNKLPKPFYKQLREALPAEYPLGIHITPHTVNVRAGTFSISKAKDGEKAENFAPFQIVAEKTFGEAEKSTFRNIKEPTMLYGYNCAIRPESQAARVQIHSRTLRDEKEHWAKDQLDAFLGTVFSRTASAEMLIEGGELAVRTFTRRDYDPQNKKLFEKVGDPLIELNSDQYPTAVFQRRIIRVSDPSGQECMALEEDMSRMRLKAIDSNKKVTVASIRDRNKFDALDKALEATEFDRVVQKSLAESSKDRADFSIVIKPNFMFAYNKRDETTYTDPELVAHLVARLRCMGFENVAVVEAQSTYGEYFDRRSVREVAEYLGYNEKAGYKIIDMTEDARESQHLGSHLGSHPVSTTWRDADFRISFAKNKTHAYAYYTLTLKNVYGALPMANKFKEYHCDRDIYYTTIEYLSAFPVHFGLVDAYISADGPFGIFADTCPNVTYTILAGEDLVAVDWVAATKMGIDPMISQYMRLAVKAFGKPEIQLIGDASMYRPWLNVPVVLTLFTHKGLDASHYFGNIFYSACAQMDGEYFSHKSNAIHIKLLRKLTVPLRRTFFKRNNEKPTWSAQLVNWVLYRLGF